MSTTRRTKGSSLTIVAGNEVELYVDADESVQKDNPARDDTGRVFSKRQERSRLVPVQGDQDPSVLRWYAPDALISPEGSHTFHLFRGG